MKFFPSVMGSDNMKITPQKIISNFYKKVLTSEWCICYTRIIQTSNFTKRETFFRKTPFKPSNRATSLKVINASSDRANFWRQICAFCRSTTSLGSGSTPNFRRIFQKSVTWIYRNKIRHQCLIYIFYGQRYLILY